MLRGDMMQTGVVEVFVAEHIRERNRLSTQRDASRGKRAPRRERGLERRKG